MNVFLVDDDQEDQEIFEMAVAETGALVNLKCFNSADSFLEHFKNSANILPDLLFLDLNMPRINGKDCLRIMAQDNLIEKIKVVVYSTSNSENDISETKAIGAHHYLVKPTSFQYLVQSLKGFFVH